MALVLRRHSEKPSSWRRLNLSCSRPLQPLLAADFAERASSYILRRLSQAIRVDAPSVMVRSPPSFHRCHSQLQSALISTLPSVLKVMAVFGIGTAED
jgi:hypothetical protein